jgi:hypothetical protein
MKNVIKKMLPVLLLFSVNCSFAAEAPSTADDPIKDAFRCTSEELIAFITPIQNMQKLPVKMPSTKEVTAANLEAICKADPDSDECKNACLSMPGFQFPDLWKDLVEAYETLIASFPKISSGGSILDALNAAYDKAMEKVKEMMNENICELIDFDSLKDNMTKYIASNVTKVVKDKYKIDLNNLDASSEALLKKRLNDKYGGDSKYFFDPDKFSEDQKKDALNEIKKEDKEFWKGL